MNRIICAKAIAVLFAGFVGLNASTASATLMVRLTETTSSGTVSITIEDGGVYDSDPNTGSISFTSFNGIGDLGDVDFFAGFNAFIGGNLEALSNLGVAPSGLNTIWNTTFQASTMGPGSMQVEVSDVGFMNSSLAAGNSAIFQNEATLFKVPGGSGVVEVTDLASYLTPDGVDFDLSGTPLHLDDLATNDTAENSMVLTGPAGEFSLVSKYTVTHTGNASSSVTMTTQVAAPEPGSLLVWGGISLAGVAMVRRRRQMAAA